MKVVTYNINRGLSSAKKREALAKIVRVLEDSEADVACLQEVWKHRDITEDNLEKLTAKIWPHYIFNRNAVFPGGIQGNAVLSRNHIKSWKNTDVSISGVEPRGFIDARIELPGITSGIALICLHFGLSEKERSYQADRLITYVKEDLPPRIPIVVAGDFNDWTGTVHRKLLRDCGLAEAVETWSGKRGRTFPAIFPILSLDRIYYHGFDVSEARVLRDAGWKGLSDHLAVYSQFQIQIASGEKQDSFEPV